MSTLKADAVTSAQDNTALTLSGTGTGGVKVNDFFVQTKGADIASDTALTLGKDGNQFDVTGTTTITSIATQGIGSIVTLHFDGALTFTHHSTNLILPGAASITTAAGDIAVMYEYASADWRCVSYTKASGAAVVAAGGGWEFVEAETASADGTITFAHTVASGYDYIITLRNIKMSADVSQVDAVAIQVGIGGTPTFQTSAYTGMFLVLIATTPVCGEDTITDGMPFWGNNTIEADNEWSAEAVLLDPGSGAVGTDGFIRFIGTIGSTGAEIGGLMQYQWPTATAVTGLRIDCTGSQTMTSGELILSRRKLS